MLKNKIPLAFVSMLVGAIVPVGAIAQPPQQPQYPPQQQQYPPQQQQYPPQQQGFPPQQQQYPPQQRPQYAQQSMPQALPPEQLGRLVDRIALYPDSLLAQVMTASTFSNQIQDAAGWANEHRNLNGEGLARAISEDRLPWDPSVIALLPFPSVLDMMARDMGWTEALGNAVLVQRFEVMDSVQRMRQRAQEYGYLQNNSTYRVEGGPGDIQIMPVDPGYVVVPRYDPLVVYGRPRAGFFVGGAITFGPRVYLGSSFAPWGWSGPAFGWRSHDIIIDRHPWVREYSNRDVYVHQYASPYRRPEGARIERHENREHHDRDERERH